jgi:hypothetical protein
VKLLSTYRPPVWCWISLRSIQQHNVFPKRVASLIHPELRLSLCDTFSCKFISLIYFVQLAHFRRILPQKWLFNWKKILSRLRNPVVKQFPNKIPLTLSRLTTHIGGRTAPLISCLGILYIYSTNIGTDYFKLGINSPLFSFQNSVCFIILTYLVPVLFTFYIQGVLNLKKIIPAPKG